MSFGQIAHGSALASTYLTLVFNPWLEHDALAMLGPFKGDGFGALVSTEPTQLLTRYGVIILVAARRHLNLAPMVVARSKCVCCTISRWPTYHIIWPERNAWENGR